MKLPVLQTRSRRLRAIDREVATMLGLTRWNEPRGISQLH